MKNLKITLRKTLICMFFIICFNAVKVQAMDVQKTVDGIEIKCDYYNKTATVVGYKGENTVVTIPSEFDGCKVTEVCLRAFASLDTIQIINIPNTIENIGEEAFEECKNLKEVNFDKDCNIEVLPRKIFLGCELLSKVVYPSKGFIKIEEKAFSECYKLRDCYISNRTEYIGDYAFNDTSIDSVNFTKSVKTIGKSAFRECSNITNVEIPMNVEDLGVGAFEECDNIANAIIESTTIKSETFKGCINLNRIILGENVKKIGKSAFSGTAINKIVIPDTAKLIEGGVFYNCENLRDVYVLSKDIEWKDYYDCDKIFSSNLKITIYGFVGSETENCAKKYGISFVPIQGAKVKSTINDDNKVVLNWNSVEDVQKYLIYRSNKENGKYEIICELSSDTYVYTDDKVERGKTYYYYVAAQKMFGNTQSGKIISNCVEAKVSGVAIKISDDYVDINEIAKVSLWASDDVKNVKYEIDNPNIVSVEWGKDWHNNKVAVKLLGEKRGSTKITFSNDYNSDIVEMYVTVSQQRIKLSRVNIGKWKKVSKKNASVVEYKIKWERLKYADGYEVMEGRLDDAYKQWSSSKYTTKKTSCIYMTSRLDTSKVKIKVRAYRYEGNKKVYGEWSKLEITKIEF